MSHEENTKWIEARYEYYIELGYSEEMAADYAAMDLEEGNFDEGSIEWLESQFDLAEACHD